MKIKVECTQCKKVFERVKAEVARRDNGNKRHYCSRKCAAQWQRENHSFNYRDAKIKRVCQRCGKEFADYPSNRKSFCSRSCLIKDFTYDGEGYVILYMPEHPKATQSGRIRKHRHVMEQHLGRYLQDNEVVHHINGNIQDNRIENLMLCGAGEHQAIHGKNKKRAPRGHFIKTSAT